MAIDPTIFDEHPEWYDLALVVRDHPRLTTSALESRGLVTNASNALRSLTALETRGIVVATKGRGRKWEIAADWVDWIAGALPRGAAARLGPAMRLITIGGDDLSAIAQALTDSAVRDRISWLAIVDDPRVGAIAGLRNTRTRTEAEPVLRELRLRGLSVTTLFIERVATDDPAILDWVQAALGAVAGSSSGELSQGTSPEVS